ncbi:hypothetical protein C882_4262 [Caenispirillum salinarum AK4]|uniref:Mut7-C RNAse domain-containing protein n=1 Tax=Caenispirillum salinarum AK4 TaxID=1238182 RepID=K9GY43_9PROT|nr:Mut7-C RNAse domain-containing protein [Caenispirillum salinarum]EKV30925.1 hypothetical protein C882_4262 [Caenispirillum salinarum AK4]
MSTLPASEADARRLLCDEMLVGLARWLRAAGHDATTPVRGEPDQRLIARAAVQDRLFVTRDRPILKHRAAAGLVVVLESDDLDRQAAELRERLRLDWLAAPFSRCLVCNVPVDEAGPEDVGRIPEQARALPGPFRVCPECDRVYWPGSHERRMRARLETWATS